MKKNRKQALTMLLAVLLVLTMLAGCSAKKAPAAAEAAYDYYAMEEPAAEEPAAAPAEPESYARNDSLNFATDAVSEEAQTANPQTLSEKIIYSGYIRMETTEFDKAIETVEHMVNELGGFIQNSEIDGRTEYNSDGTSTLVDRTAGYAIRVPSAKFNECMKRSGSIGNVMSSNTVADNITSQFTDTEARKKSLEVQEERLLAMMEQTTDVESLIQLEDRVSNVRYEIDSMERQLQNWQRSVDYSTVTLSITEVEIYTPVVPVTRSYSEKLQTAFADGWNGFVEFVKNFTIWFAEALPTLVLLALIALAVILIIRAIKRKKAKRRAARYAQPVQAPAEAPENKE